MAFAVLGDSRRAWELLTMINPINHANTPESIATYINCIPNLNRSILDHEMVHQYDVNLQSPCAGGHDPINPNPGTKFNLAWCGALGGSCAKSSTEETRCLMSGVTDTGQWDQNIDEINRLDCEELKGIAVSCGIQSCEGVSIRTQQDPY